MENVTNPSKPGKIIAKSNENISCRFHHPSFRRHYNPPLKINLSSGWFGESFGEVFGEVLDCMLEYCGGFLRKFWRGFGKDKNDCKPQKNKLNTGKPIMIN